MSPQDYDPRGQDRTVQFSLPSLNTTVFYQRELVSLSEVLRSSSVPSYPKVRGHDLTYDTEGRPTGITPQGMASKVIEDK